MLSNKPLPVFVSKESDPNGSFHKASKLTWDEEAITEHNILRGTRQKIDEPDTPFTTYEEAKDDPEAFSLDDDGGEGGTSTSTSTSTSTTAHSLSFDIGSASADSGGSSLTGSSLPKSPSEMLSPSSNATLAHQNSLQTNLSELNMKLSKVASDGELSPLTTVGMEVDCEEEKEKEFSKKRGAHYNEFEVMKRMREQMAREDADEEEEEEEEDEMNE